LKAKQSILSIFLLLSFGLVIETKCQSWNSEPKAGFTVKSISGISCEDKVSFSDTSKIVNACNIAGDSCDQVSEWFWDFGDGTTSNLRNPSHDYTHADFTKGQVFQIKLRIKSLYGRSDSASYFIMMSGPVPNFKILGGSTVNIGDTIVFENISFDPIFQPKWVWNFGDGTKIWQTQKQNAQHSYRSVGNFEIYLSLSDLVNGTSMECTRTYPDTMGVSKYKVIVTVQDKLKNSQTKILKLQILPNPVTDFFIVNNIQKGSLKIYNLSGNIIVNSQFVNNTKIDVSSLNTGLYLIEVKDGMNTFRTKIIKL
jgi:hypothetical protein